MSTTPQAKRKPGGQSKYTAELGTAICGAIADGASLSQALQAAKVPVSTWFDWLGRNDALAELYAHARQALGDKLGAEVVATAQTATPETANAVRVVVDAMKWAASRMSPKNWGDRVGLEHSGKDGGPLRVQVEVVGGSDE